MISDTDFIIDEPELVSHACARLPPRVASASEIEEIQAECEAGRALCLSCEDAMIVVDLRVHGDALEMFIWVAVAFRFGAFERQVAALGKIGRELGASTIAFQSRRRGWARRLGPEWTRRGTDEFVRSTDGRWG